MVNMKTHGRAGMGIWKVLGETLTAINMAVEVTPASFERESFVFIFLLLYPS
jgi:hypothetical protein